MVTLSKEITYLELVNTFLITQAKTPKEVGHQSYVSEIKLATRDTFLRLKEWNMFEICSCHLIRICF